MGQSRHHYERSFESYLRARRTPYVSVNEAKRALLPSATKLTAQVQGSDNSISLKSFDFVIYGSPANLLVEIKGRRIGRAGKSGTTTRSSLQSWITRDDVQGLARWQTLFGEGFRAAIVFVYWCNEQPPDALFQEVYEHEDRWYAVRAVLLDDYRQAMVTRSARWNTVHVPSAAFERISSPLASASPGLPRRISSAPALQREIGRVLRGKPEAGFGRGGNLDQQHEGDAPALLGSSGRGSIRV